jgi:hypothetical protein
MADTTALQTSMDTLKAAVNGAWSTLQTLPTGAQSSSPAPFNGALDTSTLNELTTLITSARTILQAQLTALGVDSDILAAHEALHVAIENAGLDLAIARGKIVALS